MELIFTICVFIICTLMFVDIKVGIATYIIFNFLVPIDPRFFVLSSSNMVQLSMIISLSLYLNRRRTNESFNHLLKPFAPLIVLYFLFLVISVFGNETPFSYVLLKWQLHVRKYFLLPIIMWYVSKTDAKAIKWFNSAFIVSGIFILFYGIFLLFTDGFNPYIFIVSTTFGASEWANVMNERNSFRYMYRISSFFLHPMSYGLYLCLFAFFLYSIRKKLYAIVFLGLMALNIICVLMCGVRTSMVCFFLGIIVYLFCLRQFRTSLWFLFLGAIGYYIVSLIPEINGTIESIYNSDKEISGSSIDSRIEQFNGCFKEIVSCLAFGKGYEWTQFYLEKFGNHPTMLAFESVIIKVLCNSGVVGMISYVICYYKFTTNTFRKVYSIEAKAIVVTIVAVYVSYCIATGDYDYLSLFMPFYTIFMINHCQAKNFIRV